MDTITAIHTRRSIRAFLDRAVPRALVEEVVRDAAQAPRTPVSGEMTFTVIEGRAFVAACGERAKTHARVARPQVAGFSWADRPEFSVFNGAPVAVVIAAEAANAESAGDCIRAGQNLMLSAHARGLGTCWVGAPMLWLGDAEVKRMLGIPPERAAFAAFALGYPDGTPQGSPRARPRIDWVRAEA